MREIWGDGEEGEGERERKRVVPYLSEYAWLIWVQFHTDENYPSFFETYSNKLPLALRTWTQPWLEKFKTYLKIQDNNSTENVNENNNVDNKQLYSKHTSLPLPTWSLSTTSTTNRPTGENPGRQWEIGPGPKYWGMSCSVAKVARINVPIDLMYS